jgi:hypothetical protein
MAETDAMKTAQWIQWLDLDTELGEDGSPVDAAAP